ncbi:MAG: lipoate protein ligase C-terminal domain-containing protein [Methanosarcinales archaeon]
MCKNYYLNISQKNLFIGCDKINFKYKEYKQGLYKSKGGLIRVFLKEKNEKIEEVIFTGDFFIFPEDSIDIIAQSLKNIALNKEAILETLDKVYLKENIESPGTTKEDFANAIMAASRLVHSNRQQ